MKAERAVVIHKTESVEELGQKIEGERLLKKLPKSFTPHFSSNLLTIMPAPKPEPFDPADLCVELG
jgi:hypothetical protein